MEVKPTTTSEFIDVLKTYLATYESIDEQLIALDEIQQELSVMQEDREVAIDQEADEWDDVVEKEGSKEEC